MQVSKVLCDSCKCHIKPADERFHVTYKHVRSFDNLLFEFDFCEPCGRLIYTTLKTPARQPNPHDEVYYGSSMPALHPLAQTKDRGE